MNLKEQKTTETLEVPVPKPWQNYAYLFCDAF